MKNITKQNKTPTIGKKNIAKPSKTLKKHNKTQRSKANHSKT